MASAMLDAPASGTVTPLTTITVSISALGERGGPASLAAGLSAGVLGALGSSVVVFVYEQLRATAASHAYPRTTIECGSTPGGSTERRLRLASGATSVGFPTETSNASDYRRTPPASTRKTIKPSALA